MQVYRAPLRDMQFVLHELFGGAPAEAQAARAIESDLAADVLSAAARFCQDVLLPLNATGDREGCRLDGSVVSTPTGFRDAYRQLCDGGWLAIAAAPAYGGQGLPQRVVKLLEEMFHAANSAFATYAGLTRGAIVALETFASEELKQRFLPALIAGSCSGTMCLTEPQSGSDLGLIETRARPRGDARFGITGTKIFVSAGEHDLAENILHFVLARLPDAPPGAKGLSLFAVPKLLHETRGSPTRNGVRCVGLEHKMGLHGSATCQLAFDDATGWLVGSPHGGLRAIFSMVNSKRLSVAHQGIGIAEAALQSAAAYARSRRQGRGSGGREQDRAHAADPIIVHPDVRKTLMRMRVDTEGCRALGGWIADHLDRARDPALDDTGRQSAEEFCALMTPVAKALFTELGFETASRGLQVHGGHGFIRDHGVEQYVRDARVCMIYEGTNGIQALDLLKRKMLGSDGRLLARFSDPARTLIERHRGAADQALRDQAEALADALARLEATTALINARSRNDPDYAAAAATEYLRFFGYVALGYTWLRASGVAAALSGHQVTDASFYETKRIGAQFFFDRILPETAGMEAALRAESASVMALHPDAF